MHIAFRLRHCVAVVSLIHNSHEGRAPGTPYHYTCTLLTLLPGPRLITTIPQLRWQGNMTLFLVWAKRFDVGFSIDVSITGYH